MNKFVSDALDGGNSFVVAHCLNTCDVIVSVRRLNGNELIHYRCQVLDPNMLALRFDEAPGTIVVTVVG